jgi:hypothetical protein
VSRHEILYDADGVATNDPWSLDDYLIEDGLRFQDRGRVRESVRSWLAQYADAACDIDEAMRELTPENDDASHATRDSSVRFVADEGYWIAEDPSRPGCHHIGPSREVALAGLADAREHYDAVHPSGGGGGRRG